MNEDLVKTLCDFGFTTNQAKVYLSIIKFGANNVGRISKQTQLHRQDIYKILPKLEKKGLITKTIDKPFLIEAIPVEKSLDNLIEHERKKANEKINYLENNLRSIITSLKERPEEKQDSEARFTLLTTDDAIENRAGLSFRKVKREVSLFTNLELLNMPIMRYYVEFLQSLKENNAKGLLLLTSQDDPALVKQSVEKIAPYKGNFTAKLMDKKMFRQYQIIDRKEVWIAVQQRTETGFPCMLCTNDQNIIDVYTEHFKRQWNHSGVNVIFQSAPRETLIGK
jgi:HTH-type transcriptional regulator, sugar sensing transcriptional regulator